MALIEIKADAFGISQPATALLHGLGYGIAAVSSFATSRWRNGIAIKNYQDWQAVLGPDGISPDNASLSLTERADVQVEFNRVRGQAHIEEVGFHAVEEHRAALEDGKRETGVPIEEEWLENFWGIAARISSEDRQKLWGRVLSRESLLPGSISLRTLKFLADLTSSEAAKLQAIASCSYFCPDTETGPECGLINAIYPNAFTGHTNGHSSVSIPWNTLAPRHDEIFVPAGFWLQSGGFAHTLHVPPSNEARLKIGNRWFVIRMDYGNFQLENRNDRGVSIGVSTQITALGREVLELIEADPSSAYIAALRTAVGSTGRAELIELPAGE
jgi:hypothetical protein